MFESKRNKWNEMNGMDGGAKIKNMKRAVQTYANQNRFNKINNTCVNESCTNDSTLMERSHTLGRPHQHSAHICTYVEVAIGFEFEGWFFSFVCKSECEARVVRG